MMTETPNLRVLISLKQNKVYIEKLKTPLGSSGNVVLFSLKADPRLFRCSGTLQSPEKYSKRRSSRLGHEIGIKSVRRVFINC